MPPKQTTSSPSEPPAAAGPTTGESGAFQLPWTAIPRCSPGVTDVTEYSSKLQFLAAMWPQEHLHLLAPRAALLCEGTAFKKVSKLSADKLKTADESGIKLLVSTLRGSWERQHWKRSMILSRRPSTAQHRRRMKPTTATWLGMTFILRNCWLRELPWKKCERTYS